MAGVEAIQAIRLVPPGLATELRAAASGGKPIFKARVESEVNEIIAKRAVKKQQMQ
jgi:hypothetical protein